MIDRGQLLAALGLEPADLDLNRQGKMAPRQAEAIRSYVKVRRITVYVAIFGAGALALAGAIAARAPLHQMIGGAVGGGIFAAIVIPIMNRLLFVPLAEQAESGVRTVEGTIERRYVAYSGRGYAIWISGLRYGGTKTKVGRLLKVGERVRLFTTYSGLVVGAEPG